MSVLDFTQTRQELCEGLEYFRSWEGGVYQSKGIARGYLLDGYPSVYVTLLQQSSMFSATLLYCCLGETCGKTTVD